MTRHEAFFRTVTSYSKDSNTQTAFRYRIFGELFTLRRYVQFICHQGCRCSDLAHFLDQEMGWLEFEEEGGEEVSIGTLDIEEYAHYARSPSPQRCRGGNECLANSIPHPSLNSPPTPPPPLQHHITAPQTAARNFLPSTHFQPGQRRHLHGDPGPPAPLPVPS